MSDTIETIRGRWGSLEWRYEEERESETYVASAVLLNHLEQILLDLDEPGEDEQALLQLCAAAPGDVRSLLAVIAILQAQLGGWEASCAAQVLTARAYLESMASEAHDDEQMAARQALETAIDSNAGELLLKRLEMAEKERDQAQRSGDGMIADLKRLAERVGVEFIASRDHDGFERWEWRLGEKRHPAFVAEGGAVHNAIWHICEAWKQAEIERDTARGALRAIEQRITTEAEEIRRQQARADGLATAAAIVLHELEQDGQIQEYTRSLLAAAVGAYEAGKAGQP